MILKRLDMDLTVCQIADIREIPVESDFYFVGRTDEEISLVCKTEDTPTETIAREDGWSAFRIEGVLDFSLVGILSKISAILAEAGIGIFAVSTYNTDYILVKKENFGRAMEVLAEAGYEVAGK
ncbi:MAG: ACT domain-containing protein [Clostridiales bacterium]|nr:ACT domain-containing protein [Clostridiales bacterium]